MTGPGRPAPSGSRLLAWASAATPLTVSLAANIAWGWRTGSPILIVAGVVTPLLLVLAIERWQVMPPAVGVEWWVRTLAMSGVVVVVAGWSWLHATALLLGEVAQLHHGPPAGPLDTVLRVVEVVLCVAAPLAVDGLAVLSVLALDSGATSSGASGGTPGRAGETDRPDGHDPDAAPDTDETTRSTAMVARIIYLAGVRGLTRPEIRDQAVALGVSRSQAYNAIRDLIVAGSVRDVGTGRTVRCVTVRDKTTDPTAPDETPDEPGSSGLDPAGLRVPA